MGIYYTLKNGEQVEITVKRDEENYKEYLVIILFNGSMSFEYEINKALDLNKILEEIERDYQKIQQEDQEAFYTANGFYD